MGKRGKKGKSRHAAERVENQARNPKAAPDSPGLPRRSFFRDLMIGLIVCIAFFGTLEVGLRFAGIPSTPDTGDPYVGFSALQPLFVVKNGKASTAIKKLKYFNQVSFPVQKRPGTFRIFCFGGSTTYGHPFDGRTAYPRWLGELLAASAPGRDFQVINAGGISYASYRIVPLIKETLDFKPDLVIVYNGENEFLERRTYSGLVTQGRALVTLRSALEQFHTYQGLELLLKPLARLRLSRGDAGNSVSSGPGPRKAVAPNSGSGDPPKTVLRDDLTTILDQSAGLDLYHRDEEFSRGVVQHFSYNLGRMIRMCERAGVPIIFVEPASNLKDFSPFKSEHSPGLDGRTKAKVEKTIAEAARSIERRQFKKALKLIEQCTEVDPLYAMAHYLTGKAFLGLRRSDDALKCFIRAKDLDVCPLRATTPILEALDRNARDAAAYIRFPNVLSKISNSKGGCSTIPGNETFLDHVHPKIEGHQRLAEAILQEMVRLGLVRPTRSLSRRDKDAIYERVMVSLDPNFFAMRDWNLAKTLYWAGKRDEARAALLRAAKHMDSNPGVHSMLASFLLDDGDYQLAVEESEKAVKLSANDPTMSYGLAIAYFMSGRNDEAEIILRGLVDRGEKIPGIYSKLALIYLGSGRTADAIDMAKFGLKRSPDDPALLDTYGLALAASGKPAEGIKWLLDARRKEPANPRYVYDLATVYALAQRKDEAFAVLEAAARDGRLDADKLQRDTGLVSLRQDPRFEAVLGRMR